MDAIKQGLLRIQQQLSGLSASQRMLTVALLAIIVMTILWWARYAGTAEMEPLLDQPMTAEEISRIKSALAARGTRYTVSGDRLLVPADRKYEALADLAYAQLLPQDFRNGFDEMVQRTSLFDSQARTDQFMNRAREITLSQVISRYPGVRSATVTIDPSRTRRIGANLQPTAAVSVQMKSSEPPGKQLVEAIAGLVSGSIAGLTRSNVSVIIDGRYHRAKDPDNDPLASGSEILDMLQGHERRLEAKIVNHFAYIPGLAAAVTVQLDASNRTRRETVVDPARTLHKERVTETETEETTGGTSASEPGAMPNMTLEVPTAAATPSSSVRENSRSEFTIIPSTTEETISTPAGQAKPVSAAVRVPYSHFVGIWKQRNPSNTAEPDEPTLRPLIEAELSLIRLDVMKMTGITVESDVTVATYMDGLVMSPPPSTTSSSTVGTLVSGNVREIAVGVLALASLLMVSLMVRRAAPTPAVAQTVVDTGPQEMTAGETVAGEVGEGVNALVGQELDGEQLESHQMMEQVSTMVKENPDAAAQLIRRWLNRT